MKVKNICVGYEITKKYPIDPWTKDFPEGEAIHSTTYLSWDEKEGESNECKLYSKKIYYEIPPGYIVVKNKNGGLSLFESSRDDGGRSLEYAVNNNLAKPLDNEAAKIHEETGKRNSTIGFVIFVVIITLVYLFGRH